MACKLLVLAAALLALTSSACARQLKQTGDGTDPTNMDPGFSDGGTLDETPPDSFAADNNMGPEGGDMLQPQEQGNPGQQGPPNFKSNLVANPQLATKPQDCDKEWWWCHGLTRLYWDGTDCDGDGARDFACINAEGVRSVILSSNKCQPEYGVTVDKCARVWGSDGSCSRLDGWCTGNDRFAAVDCDGDGTVDMACLSEKGVRSVIRARDACKLRNNIAPELCLPAFGQGGPLFSTAPSANDINPCNGPSSGTLFSEENRGGTAECLGHGISKLGEGAINGIKKVDKIGVIDTLGETASKGFGFIGKLFG